jgi:hypothetical protein
MKTISNYQKARRNLKDVSDMAKSQFSTDKPMIRQIINDSVHYQAKEYNLSEYETNLLSNYACKLHPKN